MTIFPILNDEQMSNWLGVENQPGVFGIDLGDGVMVIWVWVADGTSRSRMI